MAERALEAELREDHEQNRQAERDSVGAMLARARRQRDQEVADVAANLRIRRVYLQAIEEGRYAELPGTTYAVGFVRSYAEYLDLDSEFLVERFRSEIAGLDRKQSLHFPAPKPEGKLPGGALVVISVLLIALTYGGWYYANQNNLLDDLLRQTAGHTVADVPDAPRGNSDGNPAPAGETATAEIADVPRLDDDAAQPPVTPPPPLGNSARQLSQTPRDLDRANEQVPAAEMAALPPQPEAARDAVAEPADDVQAEPAPGVPGRSADPSAPQATVAGEAVEPTVAEATEIAGAVEANAVAEPEAEIAAVATETPDSDIPAAPDLPSESDDEGAGRVYGVGNVESRVTLTATSDSWVQVRSADDNLLITRVLRAGDAYRVPNQQGLTLETGNAGGLAVTVDGRTAPPLGGSGIVLRGVSLEPQALLSGQATP